MHNFHNSLHTRPKTTPISNTQIYLRCRKNSTWPLTQRNGIKNPQIITVDTSSVTITPCHLLPVHNITHGLQFNQREDWKLQKKLLLQFESLSWWGIKRSLQSKFQFPNNFIFSVWLGHICENDLQGEGQLSDYSPQLMIFFTYITANVSLILPKALTQQ
jgi:hypothetical protein